MDTEQKKQLKRGIYVYILVILLGLIVNGIALFIEDDPLNKVIFKSECLYKITGDREGKISWWPVSHFIMYFILGIVAPRYWMLWFTLGTIWELIEYLVGYIISEIQDDNDDNNDDNNEDNEDNDNNDDTQYVERWVSGSINDIIFNLIGLIVGIFVNYLFNILINEKVF